MKQTILAFVAIGACFFFTISAARTLSRSESHGDDAWLIHAGEDDSEADAAAKDESDESGKTDVFSARLEAFNNLLRKEATRLNSSQNERHRNREVSGSIIQLRAIQYYN